MSGPYRVLTEEELRELDLQKQEEEMRRSLISEQLLIIQQGYSACNAAKTCMTNCEPIVSMINTMPGVEKAAQMGEKVGSIQAKIRRQIRDWEATVRIGKNTTSDEIRQKNAVLQRLVRELNGLTKNAGTNVMLLGQKVRSFQIEHFDKVLSECTARARRSKASNDEWKAAEDEILQIKNQRLNAERARLSKFISSLEERAGAVGVDCANAILAQEEITLSVEDSTSSVENKLEMLHAIDVRLLQTLEDEIESAERRTAQLDFSLSRELADYHALCMEAGVTPRKFPFAEESINEIRKACGELMAQRDWMLKRTFVLSKIRRYMSEKGFAFIGEKTERPMLIRQAYRIGKDMAFHVVFDEKGQMTIEVAKTDTVDRAPHPREVEHIVEVQHASCETIEKMFDALNELGLRTHSIYAFDGGEEFAQVINVSGFTGGETEDVTAAMHDMYKSIENKYMRVR